jgi:protease-4
MAESRSALGRFFGGLLQVYRVIRAIFFNLIFLLLLFLFLSALVGQPPVTVHAGSTLLLNPKGTLVEQETLSNPLSLISSNGAERNQVLMQDLLDVIATAKEDSRIKAMLVMTDGLQGAGLSQLLDLEHAISDFRQSGKKVYAWGSNYGQGQYLLASAADEIIMNNFGEVGLTGFGIYQNYLHDALDKLGVNVHIFRVGEYKSAVEPYSRNNMSPESRANYTRLLGDLWTHYVHEVETNRKLNPGTIEDYINHFDQHLAEHKGSSADLAKATNLVDRLVDRPAAVSYLKEQLGTRGDNIDTIDYRHYHRTIAGPTLNPGNRLAVIVADGEIVDGEAQAGSIGGETMANLIRDTTKDAGVKALVLRVNSPGGSAFASELIRAEVAAFKASGRPVVVSMGDTAASGGYWISTAADKIVASPATLTGSIGIFGLGFTLENSFSKIGVSTDGVGTTPLAGANALGRPMSDLTGRIIQQQIQYGYEKFLMLVGDARGLDRAQADAIAQGQVWSGQTALDKKLVDQLGNLQDAIKLAAGLAKLENYQLDVRQPTLTPTEQILKQILDKGAVQAAAAKIIGALPRSPVQTLLDHAGTQLDWLLHANDPDHIYVRCLECVSMKL